MAPSPLKRKRTGSECTNQPNKGKRLILKIKIPRPFLLTLGLQIQSTETKNKLLSIANEVALDLSRTTKWSSYHAWKSVSSLRATDEAGQFAEYEQLWTTPLPYGTCVDHAYASHRELRRKLLEIPELAHFASIVQLLGAYRKSDETGKAWRAKEPYHALAALILNDSIIVVDVTAHPTAFLLHVGQEFGTLTRMEFPNRKKSPVFRYSSAFGENGEPVLSNCEKDYREDYKQISYEDALRLIKFPNARRTVSVPAQKRSKTSRSVRESPKNAGAANVTVSRRVEEILGETHMPGRKEIYFDYFLLAPSEKLMYVQTPRGYFTTWAKISIDFMKKSLGLLVPLADWLEKPEQEHIRHQLTKLNFPMRQGGIQCYIFLDLTEKRKLSQRVEFFSRLCATMCQMSSVEVDQLIRDTNGGQDPILWKGYAILPPGDENIPSRKQNNAPRKWVGGM
ncbi:uncharacterized protein EI97DRAFT_453840 [Westerdykella ornata]|uniref:Uncharacterized protein n=1 Tax=Westerdykella ornata TaxID=318751 RepID=A0A6A6JWJ8_WESOR|nr:uncharacterized protein EI97DRAFT_453840 [Westerdykella ornata]KAF2280574.1 hypothetical protein EI97DRAFT_453840 [Westerdykella ornata]